MNMKGYELKNKNLHLEKINADNFLALYDLEVSEEQKQFVASNRFSMAEAYARLSNGQFVQCFGIIDGDTPVGFAMIGHDVEEEGSPESVNKCYLLWRFMIGQQYQRRGYGRDALHLLLDWVLTFPDGPSERFSTTYEPNNEAAKHLYTSFGFIPTGEKDCDDEEDAEDVAVLPLTDRMAKEIKEQKEKLMEQENLKNDLRIEREEDVSKYLPEIDREEVAPEIIEALSENDEDFYTIFCREKAVGLSCIVPDDEDGYLFVYIFQPYRGKGYGHLAAAHGERRLLEQKVSAIHTHYRWADENAKRFAESCGFRGTYASAEMIYRGEAFELPELPIRPYEDKDYIDAFTLFQEAFHRMRLSTGCFPDSVAREPSEASRKRWAESDEDQYVFVKDGKVIGYADVDGTEIDSVSIEVSEQGKGYGKAFVKYLVNRILEKDEDEPTLWCVVGNNKARRLYDSLGFEEIWTEAFAKKKVLAEE